MRVLTAEECAEIVREFDSTEAGRLDENSEFYYRNSVGISNLPSTLKHADQITQKIKQKFPGAVFNTTYIREYKRGSYLKVHTDRKGLDLTLSVCLEKNTPVAWPLCISRKVFKGEWETTIDGSSFKDEYDAYDMTEGVGAICEGRKYPHWREELNCAEDERAVFVFYHWTLPKASMYRPSMVVKHPAIEVYDNFLSEAECKILIALASPKLSRSTVVDDSDGGSVVNDHRTSHGMSFSVGENAIIQRIESKISELTGYPVHNGEGMQVLRYEVGQEYRPHHDYFSPNYTSLKNETDNNRICTVLLYLNTPLVGGATTFPNAGIEVAAKQGTALVFSYPTASPETKTLHAGTPVILGEKWVATKWIRKNKY